MIVQSALLSLLQVRLRRVPLLESCVDFLVAGVDERRKHGSSSDVMSREWLRGFVVLRIR